MPDTEVDDLMDAMLREQDLKEGAVELDANGNYAQLSQAMDQTHRLIMTIRVLVNMNSVLDGRSMLDHFGQNNAAILGTCCEVIHDRCCTHPKVSMAQVIAQMIGMSEQEFEQMITGGAQSPDSPSALPTFEELFGTPPTDAEPIQLEHYGEDTD